MRTLVRRGPRHELIVKQNCAPARRTAASEPTRLGRMPWTARRQTAAIELAAAVTAAAARQTLDETYQTEEDDLEREHQTQAAEELPIGAHRAEPVELRA